MVNAQRRYSWFTTKFQERTDENFNDTKAQLLERQLKLFSNPTGRKHLHCQRSTTVGLHMISPRWRNDRRFHVSSSNAMRNNRFRNFRSASWFFSTTTGGSDVRLEYMYWWCRFNDWKLSGAEARIREKYRTLQKRSEWPSRSTCCETFGTSTV